MPRTASSPHPLSLRRSTGPELVQAFHASMEHELAPKRPVPSHHDDRIALSSTPPDVRVADVLSIHDEE